MTNDNMYMKDGKIDGKIGNFRKLGNRNEIEVMKLDVEQDGEEDAATSKAQPKKYENLTSNTNTNNDSQYNSSTHAGRDIIN